MDSGCETADAAALPTWDGELALLKDICESSSVSPRSESIVSEDDRTLDDCRYLRAAARDRYDMTGTRYTWGTTLAEL